MRNTALTLLTGLALAATAQAGEDYSAKAPAPAPAPCLWEWFAGASGGYAFAAEAPIWNLHVGAEYSCPGSDSSHALFVEVGYGDWSRTDDKVSDKNKFDVLPVTINYKYEMPLTQSLNWFVGGGLGVARQTTEASLNFDAYNTNSKSNTKFYGQLFAGLVYNVSEQVEVFSSARYIYNNHHPYTVGGGHNLRGNLANDFYLDLGLRYNF